MESAIILCSSSAKDGSLYLHLSKSFSQYSGQESLDVVYQDGEYSYILEGIEFIHLIIGIRLFINNKELSTEYNIVEEKETTRVYINPRSTDAKRPFLLLYGVTEITVCVQYDAEVNQFFFSSYLAIAVRQEYAHNIESIKDMLDDIYKKDHALLHKGKVQNEVVRPTCYQFSDDKFSREITLLNTILTSLKRLLPYFLIDPHTVAVPEWVIDNFEKLHTIQSKNINYIATHPEQLRTTQGAAGIFIHKHRMIPARTLVSTSKFSCDTSENRAVVSFIQTLFFYLKQRKIELSNALLKVKTINLKEAVLEKYIISVSIIQQYTLLTISEHLSEIETFLTQCSAMLLQYEKALPCSCSTLHQIPAPTHCFLEIYHYRHVYELINRWFTSGDYVLPNNNLILHFSSADAIYEYFCLLNLYDVLINSGFSEHTEQRNCFKYSCNDPRYIQCENDNTFYFHNESCEITLYYQPIIYSKDCATRNGITLFRTDGSYYSPDFVIKKQTSAKISYCILDAKWRPQQVLLDRGKSGGLCELSYKYMYSIVDENTLRGVSFFWLLQGKDDGQGTYCHNHGRISKMHGSYFCHSTGIVRISPMFGNQEVLRILNMFLAE